MKYFFIFFVLFSIASIGQAQTKKRVSPMDSVSAKLRSGATVKIVYSSPSLRGRALDKIITFGDVWRTGANEATTFEVNKKVTVEGKTLPAGKYSLYTIPTKKTTTIIFNKNWDQWGTKYDEEYDVLRVNVPTKNSRKITEQLSFSINSRAGKVAIDWEKWQVEFKVK